MKSRIINTSAAVVAILIGILGFLSVPVLIISSRHHDWTFWLSFIVYMVVVGIPVVVFWENVFNELFRKTTNT